LTPWTPRRQDSGERTSPRGCSSTAGPKSRSSRQRTRSERKACPVRPCRGLFQSFRNPDGSLRRSVHEYPNRPPSRNCSETIYVRSSMSAQGGRPVESARPAPAEAAKPGTPASALRPPPLLSRTCARPCSRRASRSGSPRGAPGDPAAFAAHPRRVRLARIAEWSQPGISSTSASWTSSCSWTRGGGAGPRWQASGKFQDLGALLAEVPDRRSWCWARRLGQEHAAAALGDGHRAGRAAGEPPKGNWALTFFVPLSLYKPPRPGAPLPTPREWLEEHWAGRFKNLPGLGELLEPGGSSCSSTP